MTGRIDNNAPTGEGEPRIVEIGRGIYTIAAAFGRPPSRPAAAGSALVLTLATPNT